MTNTPAAAPADLGTVDLTVPDDFTCPCGNHPCDAGFYPCDDTGKEIEPAADSPWCAEQRIICAACGRTFRMALRTDDNPVVPIDSILTFTQADRWL